jgi:hypothetical protein
MALMSRHFSHKFHHGCSWLQSPVDAASKCVLRNSADIKEQEGDLIEKNNSKRTKCSPCGMSSKCSSSLLAEEGASVTVGVGRFPWR